VPGEQHVGHRTMTDKRVSPRQENRKAEISGLLVDLFRKPAEQLWITYSVIAVCVVICTYLNLSEESSLYSRITEDLIPSSVIIWSGAYWGLLTSAFVHFDIWHIVFNMWWLKDFGKLLEPTMGRSRYFMFIIAAAVISSGAELAVTSEVGIGFSGVVYAMFGYLLAARHTQPAYQQILTKQTIIWLLGWLVLCVVLTYTQVWRVANAAHIAGLLFGYCVGNALVAQVRVALNKAALSALIALTILSFVYMPWSETWKHRKFYAEMIAVGDAAAAGNAEAQYKYSGILHRYGKKTEEMSWLKKAASQQHLPAMNALAWNLATDRDDTLRDGNGVVKLAEKACQKDNWNNSQYIDTLAAAYAEVERWNDAVKTQRLAITKSGTESAETKASFESRLQQYLRHEKARE
jgi:membrane associated rhomboid family serine protease